MIYLWFVIVVFFVYLGYVSAQPKQDKYDPWEEK